LERNLSYGSLGQTSFNVGNARITGLLGGAAQNLTLDTAGGTEGIGTESGATGISSSTSESIRLEFNTIATQLAVTLNDFGTTSFFGTWREQARFDFYLGASLIPVTSVTKQGCRADGGLASFTIDSLALGGAQFDKVEIVPIPSTLHPIFGTPINSSFYLAAFKSCLAGTCQTSLYSAGNSCP
jgi:hypothetical protein